MKVVTKLAIALLLYNAVCVRLIDWERERISKIYPTGLFCLWNIFFEKLLLMCCQRKYIYIKSQYSVSILFISADFATDVLKQKWDRVKIICRQPFRRNVQMGLSFVCFKTTEADAISSPENKLNTPKSVKSIQKHFFGKLSSR